jgi:hypothetical protein
MLDDDGVSRVSSFRDIEQQGLGGWVPTMSTMCRRCLRYFFCFLIDLDEVEREEPGGAGVLDVTNVRKRAKCAWRNA